MKACLVVIVLLAGCALANNLQSMTESAVSEPLRLLLEVKKNLPTKVQVVAFQVTKRSRELAYDLERQTTSNLNTGRRVKSELEDEVDRLTATASNLTQLAYTATSG